MLVVIVMISWFDINGDSLVNNFLWVEGGIVKIIVLIDVICCF